MMEFSNAQKGIKRIITSQKLAIIASILTGLTELLLDVLILNADVNHLLSSLPLALASLVSGFVSLVITILMIVIGCFGYLRASQDEPEFRKAMICVLTSGILGIVGFFLQLPNGAISTIFTTAGTIVEMFVMVYAVSALIKLCESCENSGMVRSGNVVLNIFVITYFIAAIDALVIRIFELSAQAQVISGIVGAIDLVLNVMQYIIFIRYLTKVSKMLAEYDTGMSGESTDE